MDRSWYTIGEFMNEFLKMDIFFVVATVVVVLLGVFALVAMFYIIRILKNVDHLSQNVSEESDHIKVDVNILRAKIRDEGMRVQHLLDLFGGMTTRHHSRKVSEKKDKES